MRRYLFLISLVAMVGMAACDEQEVYTFSDGNEIYFDKFYMNEIAPGTEAADSTKASFFFYPTGTMEIKVLLVVKLSGCLPAKDLKFGLKVVEEGTTAVKDKEYVLDDTYLFHARSVDSATLELQDTIYVTLKRTDRMENMPQGVRLVVELVPSADVALGQFERRRAVIISTVAAEPPKWWTQEVELNLLGKFSEKKYKLFLDNVDKNAELDETLIKEHPDQAIKLVMKFKQWLNEQNPPIYEEDGVTKMEVAI